MPDTTASQIVYRGMTRALLDDAYNNSKAVADSPQWLVKWVQRSAEARRRSDAVLDKAYGPRERQCFDYFPSGHAGAPLFVFIHGGYWVRNVISMFSFLAEGPNARGIDFAALGYTLAPQARLDEIVDEIRHGLTHLQDAIGPGYDPNRIYVGGWSAGGHLAAITAGHPAVRGTMPISGIFDLEPLSLNYLNDPLQLTPDEIRDLSPQHQLRASLPPMRIMSGGNELPELQRQSADYARAAQAAGLDAKLYVLPGHHHYSILDELAKADGILTQTLVELCRP
ncbi:alpha/beta hydrolase [[Pseudomonas] carboxydohydrogena]|uniref:Alpha/beta hydrolase n=1 Tax=Afipia carboxydohydrogena TaxID=290 RepID=A0ABY8BQP1_AFICR|nr:alpha/beta hydrolase [[Pseudomonas] carboxydohydrogena]WEF52314.1 alpha/beta hydrolase [[Pseudomonas] carboxydohydrogena]